MVKGACVVKEGECCNANGLSWFHKQYNSTATDFMDLSICIVIKIQINEGSPMKVHEIFVSEPTALIAANYNMHRLLFILSGTCETMYTEFIGF